MKRFIVLSLILAICSLALAQDKIKLSDEIPFDDSYRIGELDNGMKYYIKHNKKPENRAEFWLLVHAGAMQEEADQNGLAHFCEHMAFNGTKNFPDKAVLDYLQSIGMEFGPDINAWTNYNETVYTLTKVPVENKAYIDTSMLVLRDWATDVSYLDEEIEKERGVIHEEWRARNSSYSRIRDSINMKLYKGSKYAEHNVIGKLDVIDNVPEQRLRDFFNTWYRPDMQAIVAIGDIDVEETEKKIIKMFANLKMPADPEPRVEQDIPDHEETRYAIHTDEEASNIRFNMYFKQEPTEPPKTFQEYRKNVIRNLAFRILSRRIDERNQNEEQPMSYGGWGYSNIKPEKSALYAYASPSEGEVLHSASILLEEMHRALQHGFTQEELDEVKEVQIRQAQRNVREKDTRQSRSHCYSVVQSFKKDKNIMSPETQLAFYQQYMADMTLEEVEQSIQGLMTDNNRVISLSGPDNVELPNKDAIEALIKKSESKTYKTTETVKSIDDLMTDLPKPGKIIKTENIDKPDCEKWTLSNGMTMYVKFADFKEDEYGYQFYSEGGKSLYDVSQRAELSVAEGAVSGSGLADFEQIQVDRYMNGKKRFDFGGISLYNENLIGLSRIEYLEDNFKMYHLKFTNPRLDKKGYNKYMTSRENYYKNRSNNPDIVMRDSLNAIRYGYHPWAAPLEWEDYKSVEYSDELLDLYKERYSNASDFTLYLVGNFDRDELKKMAETYLASIPAEDKKENYKDLKRYYVKKPVKKTIDIPMVTPKSKVQIEYHNNMDYSYENKTTLRAIGNILDRRFTETVREEKGGTYGVATYGNLSSRPIQEYNYLITFTCDPERVNELKKVVYNEIDKLCSGDVEDHYIEEFKKAYAKKRSEDMKDNFNWLNIMSSYDQYNMYSYAPQMDELVENITKEQIVTFAKNVFKDDVKMEVVFLPKENE
ncbi:MAG: M16 family metallopeptidase [Bacteroidales bacterium]